jgi:hypothetical protein
MESSRVAENTLWILTLVLTSKKRKRKASKPPAKKQKRQAYTEIVAEVRVEAQDN